MFWKNNSYFKTREQKIQQIKNKYNVNKKIGIFAFFSLTAAMVISVHEYASFASAGWALILYLFIGGMCWFVPVAIMSAEMATVKGWTDGGLFTWVQKTIGTYWGFVAVFFQWFQITIGFITMLLFITTMFSFSFGGAIGLKNVTGIEIILNDSDKNLNYGDSVSVLTWNIVAITFAIVLFIFIIATLFQFLGVRVTTFLAKIGFISGVLIPFLLLFIFGVIFVSQVGLNGSMNSFIPEHANNISNSLNIIFELVIFVSFILSFTGIEASGSQIYNLNNPKKNYPKIMIFMVCLAFILSSIAGIFIAIATKVGSNHTAKLSYTAGMIQAFLIMVEQITNDKYTALVIARIIAFLMGFATFSQIGSWIIGPSKAMQVAAKNNLVPFVFSKLNKFGVPIYMIILQFGFVLMWMVVIIFGMMGGMGVGKVGDNASNIGFLATMQLDVLIYIVAYFLMMIAYLKFSINKKNQYEAEVVLIKYKWAKITIAILAILSNAFAFIVAFFPQTANRSYYGIYYGIIFGLFIPSLFLPLIIYVITNKKLPWKK